jgi:site-specific recombinase XerD
MLGSTAPKRVSRGDYSDLSAHIAACLHELVDQGYAKLTIDMYRGSLGHFSYWVTREKIKCRGHEEASIRRFLTTHLPSKLSDCSSAVIVICRLANVITRSCYSWLDSVYGAATCSGVRSQADRRRQMPHSF